MATTKTQAINPAEAPDLTIALDPHRPGRHRARLVHYGRPVWALIAGSLPMTRQSGRTNMLHVRALGT